VKKVTLITKCRNWTGDGYDDVDVAVYENGVPGLFVGKLLAHDRLQTGNWMVYHYSGFPLPGDGWPTRKKANEVMQELATVIDWSQDSETITRTPDLGRYVREIYARHEENA